MAIKGVAQGGGGKGEGVGGTHNLAANPEKRTCSIRQECNDPTTNLGVHSTRVLYLKSAFMHFKVHLCPSG